MADYRFPKKNSNSIDNLEDFNNFAEDKIVVASYVNHYGKEVWVLVHGVINRREGHLPYLVGLEAGHFTIFYLVYVDEVFVKHNELEAVEWMADTCPQLIQCDPEDYHENDISFYGNNNVPVYDETVRICVPAKRVNYRANYWELFEGEYSFPKDRKKKEEKGEK